MYEARQCKEKVSRRIDATGGGTSQKKHINYDWQSILNVMQRAHDLTCKTKIDYIHKGEIKSSEGDGENDIADANSVLQILERIHKRIGLVYNHRLAKTFQENVQNHIL